MRYIIILNIFLSVNLFADCINTTSLEDDLLISKRDNREFVVILAEVKGYKEYPTRIAFQGFPQYFSDSGAIELKNVEVLYGQETKTLEYYPQSFRKSSLTKDYPKGKKVLLYGMQKNYSDFDRTPAVHALHMCSLSTLKLNWSEKKLKGKIFFNKDCSKNRRTSCSHKEDEITLSEFRKLLDKYQNISFWDRVKRFFGNI